MDGVKLDAGFAHESLDRTFLVMDMFDEYVVKHPFVGQNQELLLMAREITDKMSDLYQAIGREYVKYENIP